MKIMCSYAVEIKHINRLFRDTIKIYNDAVSFCVKAFEDHWDVLKTLDPRNKERFAYADYLIHSTKTNTAVFKEFDQKFHKMPSYLRFAVINTALGHLSSYHSNLTNWENATSKEKQPSFQVRLNKLPVFYKDNMYRPGENPDTIRLKVFVNNDWNWVTVSLKHTDVVSIRNHRKDGKISAPMLEKKNKKWFLRFAFEGQTKLNDTKLEERRILAVDLGVNTDAVCSVMTKDGTIHARKFINFAGDKDRIYHTLNKIKKVQKYSGSQNTKKLWRYARFHNDELARKVASKIAETAIEYQCDVIVSSTWTQKERRTVPKSRSYRCGRKIRYRRSWNKKRIRTVSVSHTSVHGGLRNWHMTDRGMRSGEQRLERNLIPSASSRMERPITVTCLPHTISEPGTSYGKYNKTSL